MNPTYIRMKHTNIRTQLVVCSIHWLLPSWWVTIYWFQMRKWLHLIVSLLIFLPNKHQILLTIWSALTCFSLSHKQWVHQIVWSISTKALKFSLSSPMKCISGHAYTLQYYPYHAMSLWSPNKHFSPQFILDFPFPKITSVNYSFSHTCTIVQLLFRKAVIHIASWFSSSIIATYSQIEALQPWSKAMLQPFKVMLSLCTWAARLHM